MEYEIKKFTGLKRQVDIQVSPEEVQKAFNDNYQKVRKQAHVQGYRKGKAPMSKIYQIYQEEVKKESLLDLIHEFYPKVMKTAGLRPAFQPEIKWKSSIEANKAFTFFFTVEIEPEVDVDKHFKPSLSHVPIKVEEKEIDEIIKTGHQMATKYKTIEENRSVRMGDIVEVEIAHPAPLPEGKAITNNTTKTPITAPLLSSKTKSSQSNTSLFKESPFQTTQFKLEIKEEKDPNAWHINSALIGMWPKEQKTITLQRTQDNKIPFLKKTKEQNINITVLKIQKKILPKTDEQVAKFLGHKTLTEMRTFIRQIEEQTRKQKLKEKREKEILNQLTKKYPLPFLPEKIVEKQKQILKSNMAEFMKQDGLKEEAIKKNIQNSTNIIEQKARFMVHSYYLIFNLTKKLDLKVSSNEMKLYLKKTKRTQPKNEEDYQRLKEDILYQKTMNYLIDKALKPPEERIKQSRFF